MEALGLLLRACTKAVWLDGGFILRVVFSLPAGQELALRPAGENIVVQEQHIESGCLQLPVACVDGGNLKARWMKTQLEDSSCV